MGYHDGELAVQRKAGVAASAARIGNSIRSQVPPAAADFLAERTLIVVASTDQDGRPWASPLTGPSGFARAVDDHTVRIQGVRPDGDPLVGNLRVGEPVGLVALDPATRRRMRVNGTVHRLDETTVDIRTSQVYSNCPKYIQRRVEEEVPGSLPAANGFRVARALTPDQRARIRSADTFFIATFNPGEGADASHRGGMPGFVEVEGNRVHWPDYPGNTMFNTLGNIASWPRAGLLFPDFADGSVLQVTGRAGLEWDGDRTVWLEVEEVRERQGALPERLRLVDYSPFNPPVLGAG